MSAISITQPDDWHLHLREGPMMESVLRDTAQRFARAIVMPNLKPSVVSVAHATDYHAKIKAALPSGMAFEPLMTLFLTDLTTVEEIEKASKSSIVHALKYYPAGATTNSDNGVTDFKHVYAVLDVMQKQGIPLLMHGEVTDSDIDIFDREAVFIERHLIPIIQKFPELKIVLEHITTCDAAEFVAQAPANVAATITPHHLLLNRNAIFAGGLNPHHYCLPILKREKHRNALTVAATSGDPKFFLGTDSAPHDRKSKETACGCAGIYSAHAAIELYAEAFDNAGALDRLEAFASFYGADFYGLPRNQGTVTLEKKSWEVPKEFQYQHGSVVPFRAGETVSWRISGTTQ